MRLRATPWWARRLPEVPLAFAACPTAGCRDTVLSPFDLYCSGPTSHFVGLGDEPAMQVGLLKCWASGAWSARPVRRRLQR